MSRLVFDIETNGLLAEVTDMWLLRTLDIDTGEKTAYKAGDLRWVGVFNEAKLLVGHNIINFDLAALSVLFDYQLPASVNIHDTLLMSQILNYRRFGMRGHSLKMWGEHLGNSKIEFEDWSRYSEEMDVYCEQDVDLNFEVYQILVKEVAATASRNPRILPYLRAEHAVAKWCSVANQGGWKFDVSKARTLKTTLEAELLKADLALSHKLGLKAVPKDKLKGIVSPREPKWTKAGCYNAHTAAWFGIDPWSGYPGEERIVEGPYSRVEILPLLLSSVLDVKTFLFRNGWKPTEFNYKFDEAAGRKVKTSPKITEDSLEFLGGDGALYMQYLTATSRYGVLKTWLENTDDNGFLHGDCMVIGTPSMRMRHKIIVNVPSGDSVWGREMRELFTCESGWKLVGCDSSGNQARGLAHFLQNPDFIHTLLHGDIHQFNADTLTAVLLKMGIAHVVKRPTAKRILYAFLFGASGGKLWSYLFGTNDSKKGNKLKNGFMKAVPGFKELVTKLENIYGSTSQYGDGYIPGIAGNRIYVDSFHKLLVYLLQSTEKATCAAACMLTMERLEAEGIPYKPLVMMHDEIDFMVPEEYAERAEEIGSLSFKEGPELFGITIMDGDGKIGNNWYEIH